jgi:hypothetical protein
MGKLYECGIARVPPFSRIPTSEFQLSCRAVALAKEDQRFGFQRFIKTNVKTIDTTHSLSPLPLSGSRWSKSHVTNPVR